jgi:MFS family permease
MGIVIGGTTDPLQRPGMSVEERFVVFASSLGTVFEWYDFFLYAVLAPFFASLFFPSGNDTAALLSAFATYAAGFLVRPFGAMVFGRVGDLIGRKYTFLVAIMMMGTATFSTGLLPTFATIGWSAPVLLVALRLIQGIAIGGEYGGAAIYVAEHALPFRRGYTTSFINTTGTAGLALAVVVIIGCREFMEAKAFADWGWRIPFIVSAILLVFSIYIRLRLNETPIFLKMKAEGARSEAPLTESFLRYPNNKFALLALLGNCAGVSVVWYTAHFYALFFLTITLKMSYLPAYLLILISLIVASPGFVLFGWLSDHIGRLKIILTGCVLAALTYFQLFSALTHYVNPDLEAFAQRTPIVLSVDDSTCRMHIFVTAFTKFSTCDRAKDFVTKLGVSFKRENAVGEGETLSIGSTRIDGFDATRWNEAFLAAGYPNLQKNKDGEIVPKPADPAKINWLMAELILVLMVGYVTMVYGPQAAQLVELFPARIRYTSLSLPYHIGAGWFGGMLPLLATALVAAYGDIYVGLWYPIAVALMTAIVGTLFLGGREGVDIAVESGMESTLLEPVSFQSDV